MTNEEIVMKAIRNACPDVEKDCVEDEEECFKRHPIHEAGSTSGVIDSVYADVEGTAALIVAALRAEGRLLGE